MGRMDREKIIRKADQIIDLLHADEISMADGYQILSAMMITMALSLELHEEMFDLSLRQLSVWYKNEKREAIEVKGQTNG
jgi:hypothetical protein